MLCTTLILCVKVYLTGSLITFAVTSIPLWETLVKDGKVDWCWMVPAILFSLGSWYSLYSFIIGLISDVAKVQNDD